MVGVCFFFLKREVCWLQVQFLKNVPSPRKVLTGELQSLSVVVGCCLLQQKKTNNNKEVHNLSQAHFHWFLYSPLICCFCSPPGPPGGRRMGRISHGGGPNAPPMGGG